MNQSLKVGVIEKKQLDGFKIQKYFNIMAKSFIKGQVVKSDNCIILVTGSGYDKCGYPAFAGVVILDIDEGYWPIGCYSDTWATAAFEKVDINISSLVKDSLSTENHNMDIEKEVEKIIKLAYPVDSNKDWDTVVLDASNVIESEYLNLIKHLIIKEKDKLLFDTINIPYLRQRVHFDIDYSFCDTLNKLKKATIDLLNILND